jgi:hypothetical protein
VNSALYFALGLVLVGIFGLPFVPYRGAVSRVADVAALTCSVGVLVALMFFVVDATRLCQVFGEKLQGPQVQWPWRVRTIFAAQRGMNPEDVEDWLDVKLIAERTELIGRMIFYPFTVLTIMILSRLNFFDRWDWPVSLLLIMSMNAVYAFATSIILRRSAENARGKALENLRRKVIAYRASTDKGRADQLELIAREVENIREGAFRPWAQHPLVAALLIPTGGLGTWTLLEALATRG